MTLSRRQFLIGGAAGAVAIGVAGVALVETGAVPGRSRLHTALGGCGATPAVPTATPGPTRTGSFTSAARAGREVSWTVCYPPGSADTAELPVCVVLPGRGGGHTTMVEELHIDRFLAAGVEAGGAPFAVVSADGGASSFWHRRADGDDPAAMITDELLPLLSSQGLRTSRVGLLGWSMGGYGAILLAESFGTSRCAAVTAASPALWTDLAATAEGAFDGVADFTEHDVYRDRPHLAGIGVRLDCGSDDPFFDATQAFASDLPEPATTGFGPGCHDYAFWLRVLPDQLRFQGEHLRGL